MANNRAQSDDYSGPLKRLLAAVLVLILLVVFLIWRIDNPRMERFRAQIVDRVVPNFDWAMAPVTASVNLFRDFQSYRALYQQNQELKRDLQRMKKYKEEASQLEQLNAKLLDLNKVRLDPRLTYITGIVLADSGSAFRQSVLLNIGARDGVVDGWAAMDGLGLVGRISGVGANSARVVLLTDAASRVPIIIQPSGQRAIITGDNTIAPPVDFLENSDRIRPGDRVVSSGDGDVFPAGLLIGQLARDPGGRLRVRLAADLKRLEFLRVLRHHGREKVLGHGDALLPDTPVKPVTPKDSEGGGDG